jgi:cation diffusion facilitator family transporter
MSSSSKESGGHNSVKVIVIALFANLGIALAKFAGWFFTGSASMLAEGIHSVADCTNQVLLLVGNRASKRPPSKTHPLGYGRESFFWAFVVALILFSMGGLFSIYEGVHKLHSSEPLENPWTAVIILGVSIALEGGSFFACLKEVRAQGSFTTIRQWIHRTTSAELLVIFIEDLAALLGLVLALGFLLLAILTGDTRFDAIGSIAIGAVLVSVAVILGVETKSLLIGESPNFDYETEVRKVVEQVIPEGRLLRFLAQQVGANQVMISYKVHPGKTPSVEALLNEIDEIEKRVRALFPEIQWQFVEPDTEA